MFMFGSTVFDSTTVLPTLMRELGASSLLIGVAKWIQALGFALPALLAAHYIHGRSRHKPFLVATASVSRLLVQTLWPVLLLFGLSNPSFVLGYVLTVYAAFWFFDGFCAVSWTDIVAKAILPRYRARFFGLMPTINGITAIIGAAIVGWVMKKGAGVMPDSYVVLAACWAGGSIMSFILLASVREPEGVSIEKEDRPSLLQFIRNAKPVLKKYPRLRSIVLLRWTLDGAGLASAFYVLYARENLGVAGAMLGVYIVSKSLGKMLTGPIWGFISDRFSPVVAVRVIAFTVSVVPILALTASAHWSWVIVILFFFMGSVEDGLWTTCQNLLYSSVSDHDRPLAVGIASVAQVPCAFYGLLGGILVQFGSYLTAFIVALAFASAGVVVALRVPDLKGQASSSQLA
jgi:MFS family permease